jgi:serine/threonine protein kinase
MSKDERKTILELSEGDARIFIEIVDRAFRAARLDNDLRAIAFGVLRRLCGRIGQLPESYLLSDKFDLSGIPRASGGFSDVRMGIFKGKDVAVKSLRVSEMDDKQRIRRRFSKEVAMWKNLSHPNVLDLIGVPDTLAEGRFSMVSEWMVNGNIMEYVRKNSGNHLKLLADAVEGLKYLHNASIVHGDLKGANILITNTNPVSACLADFGFMTIVHDPSLEMDSSKSEVGGGTTLFMAPELLVPSKFGLERSTPTAEADIYAVAIVVYQVLTGTLPFGKQTEVVFKVLRGERPSKPENALELGLCDKVWKMLEECWQEERELRPPVENVLGCIKSAASACGILSPVGGVTQRQEDLDSGFNKFDNLFLGLGFDEEDIGSCAMERPPSQDSVTSMPESLFSKLSEFSEAETSITEPGLASTEALAAGIHSKGESTEDLPAFLFSPVLDHASHPQAPVDPTSRPSTPGSETPVRPRLFRGNSGPYRFAESNGSSRTLLEGVSPRQRDQPRSDTDVASMIPAAVLLDREPRAEKPRVVDLVASSFIAVPDAATISRAQAKENQTRQLSRPSSMLSLRGSKSRPTEPDASPRPDDNAKHKSRQSRFHIRQRLGRVLEPILHHAETNK